MRVRRALPVRILLPMIAVAPTGCAGTADAGRVALWFARATERKVPAAEPQPATAPAPLVFADAFSDSGGCPRLRTAAAEAAPKPDDPPPGAGVPGGNPVVPGEPGPETAKLFTEDAPPVDPGRTEVEFNYAFFGARQALDSTGWLRRRGREAENNCILRVKHGVVTDLDIGGIVAFTHFSDRDADPSQAGGLSELSFFAKWRFLAIEPLDLAVSYVPGFGFPLAGRTTGSFVGPPQDFYSFDQKLALTKNWGRFSASADVGYALPFGGRKADSRGNMIADIAVGWQVLPWLQPEVELNWTHNFLAGGREPDSLAVTAGVLMPLGDRWRLQVGMQQVVAGRNTDLSTAVFAGALLRF